jgi:hypothetical protein
VFDHLRVTPQPLGGVPINTEMRIRQTGEGELTRVAADVVAFA